MRTHRKAFTMLELLIVISIILVLMGLATVGFKHVTKSGKQNATKTALETCKSMLAEFSAANQKTGTSTLNAYYNTAPYLYNGQVPAPAGRMDDSGSTLQYTAPAFILTQQVIGRLGAMSNNRAMIQKIPASKLLGKPPASVTSVLIPVGFAPNPPLLLDGWGNPIIFVPTGGLTGVNVSYKGGGLDPTLPSSYDKPNQPITSPDNRPFFASAGDDGDFSKGDDNVYSFEN